MRIVLLSSHSVHFCQRRKLSYLYNFITNLSTYFSVVILEEQPTQSKNWFWATSRPTNPTFGPSQSGGPTGVWLHLSTVVFAWWLELKIKWQRELLPFTEKFLSRFGEMSCLQFWLCFTMRHEMKECFSNTNHSNQFIFGLDWKLRLSIDRRENLWSGLVWFNSYSSILFDYFWHLIF